MAYKLCEVCDVRDGTHDSPKYIEQGYPLVTSKNITDGQLDLSTVNFITEEDYNKINERSNVDEGDIIMPMIGTIGNPYLVEKYCDFAIKNVALIKFNTDKVTNRFVWYLLKSDAFKRYVKSKNKGGTQKFLALKDIREIDIPELSIEKQEDIILKLDKVSNIIALCKQQLIQLDNLIKSRFVEMFGDVIINDKQWNKFDWSEVLNIINGKSQKNVECKDGLYLICGSGGAMGRSREYLVKENSVIIGRKGNINKPILMREKFWNVDTAFGLEPYTDKMLVEYLYYFCVFFDFEQLNKAVTIPSLTKADLLKIKMPIPEFDLQKKFALFVQQVDKLKVSVQKSLEETQLLFDSLMQEYFG